MTHTTSFGLNVIKNFGKDSQETTEVVAREHELNDQFSGIFGYHDVFSDTGFIKGKSQVNF